MFYAVKIEMELPAQGGPANDFSLFASQDMAERQFALFAAHASPKPRRARHTHTSVQLRRVQLFAIDSEDLCEAQAAFAKGEGTPLKDTAPPVRNIVPMDLPEMRKAIEAAFAQTSNWQPEN